jgi:hypothetical protein
VSAPATLLPDGVVPFVDEPADESEFDGTPPSHPAPPPAKGPSCSARQLTGTLSKWISKASNVDSTQGADPTMLASQYGFVVVTNVSKSACTLTGRVDAELVDLAGTVPMDYNNHGDDAFARQVVGVPAGAHASLRLDWSAPFCGTISRPLSVRVSLANGGGSLTAPVTDETVPPCSHPKNRPGVTGGLFIGTFAPGDVNPEALPVSPLAVLRVSVLTHPDHGRAGQPIRYVVSVANPTGSAVVLSGSIGFGEFIASRGGQGVEPFQYAINYRLNRRVITSITANATVRYEVILVVPATMKAGLTMSVNWILKAPWLESKVTPTNGFTIVID